jgi:hypothetical protein
MTSSSSRKRACTHLHDEDEVVFALKRKTQDNMTPYIVCDDDNDDNSDGDDNAVGNKCVSDDGGNVDSSFCLDDHASAPAMYNDTVQFDSLARDDASSLSRPSDSDSDSDSDVPDDLSDSDVDGDAGHAKDVECDRCHTAARHVYPLADDNAAVAAVPQVEKNQSDVMQAACDAATGAAFVPSISKPVFICRRCRHVIVVVEVPSPAGTLHIPLTNFNDLSFQQQTVGALLEHMNVDFAADAAAVAVGTYVTYSTVTGGSQNQFQVDRKRSAYLQRHDVADKRVSIALYDSQHDDADDVSDVYVDLCIRREAWSMTAAIVDTIARRMKDMV